MRFLGALLAAVAGGSVAVAGYNWLLEPLIPDTPIISVTRKTADGKLMKVSYLDLDDVARVGVVVLAAVPIGMMAHKVTGGIVPTPKVAG